MRCLIAALAVVAIVVLITSSAQAGFVFGEYYFELNNWDNGGGGYGLGPSFNLPTGPTATTDGAIWLKTGSTYVLNLNDVNIECDFRTAPDQPTTIITNTCLLSTGVASGDVSFAQYPGYFAGIDGDSGWGNTHTDPSYYADGGGQYWVPATGPLSTFQFDLKFWYGTDTSFAAAQADGSIGADTGWFKAGDMASGIAFPTDSTFEYMPSVVLQPLVPTPEPSTIVLVAAGLFGLLAYAWRKRK